MFKDRFQFSSKAETLRSLEPLLKKSSIPDFMLFSVGDWQQNSAGILSSIKTQFNNKEIIIRSSSLREDGEETANAGSFLSIPNVSAHSANEVSLAIDSVVTSFQKGEEPPVSEDQILVQEMISDVSFNAVVFTQDMSTGAPYYVVNYDDESGKTDSITSGNYNNRTLYVHRDSIDELTSERFRALFSAVQEIEHIAGSDSIDIEIALDKSNKAILFQVRQITTHGNWSRGLPLRITDSLDRNEKFLRARYDITAQDNNEYLSTVLGSMPDWNPAEIIGNSPRNLASSLYRLLITDKTWRIARKQMGYEEIFGAPLMLLLSGQPFIDVRQSFQSYLPAGLNKKTGDKLVEAWLDRLRKNPHLHDKVEFDIATTCFTFDFDEHFESLYPDLLEPDELENYRACLLQLTDALISGSAASIESQLALVDQLDKRFNDFFSSSPAAEIKHLPILLEDAIEKGTIPFSILARHGFVAKSLLRSFIQNGVFSEDDVDLFHKSVPTVATDLLLDLSRLSKSKISIEDFLKKYGHLRPGTYDILSLRYDQTDIFKNTQTSAGNHSPYNETFRMSDEQKQKVKKLIAKEGLSFSAEHLIEYIRRSIKAREYAKFVFTKNLSAALELIAKWGRKHNLTREELSHLTISDIMDCLIYPKGRSVESDLRAKSEKGKDEYEVTTSVKLPFLITRISDLRIIPLSVEMPNFITRKNIGGDVIAINNYGQNIDDIAGKIVAIESADPGFDMIFSKPILGLITKFGGVNSHMSIRCAELDIPAAIGCGEQIFERVINCGSIELLCAEGRIRFDQEC